MDLLIASANPAKVGQLRALLAELPVTLRSLSDIPPFPDLEENGATFAENALTKARWAYAQTKLPTLADDSGLEIDALDGWPGVRSRRIFGDERRATDEEMIAVTMDRMADIPWERRTCRMHSVVAFVAPDGTEYTGEGFDAGYVALVPSPLRILGYPFRSLFFHPAEQGITVDLLRRGIGVSIAKNRDNSVRAILPTLHRYCVPSPYDRSPVAP